MHSNLYCWYRITKNRFPKAPKKPINRGVRHTAGLETVVISLLWDVNDAKRMKRLFLIGSVFLLLLSGALSTSSCGRKSGCPAYQSLHTDKNKRGELKSKKGKSELFSKKARKKMPR